MTIVESGDDQAVAATVAEKLRDRQGRRGGWFEVRSLMTAFGIDRFSDQAQERMSAALDHAGIHAEPPLSLVSRSDTVVLSVSSAQDDAKGDRASAELSSVVTARVASPGQPLRVVPLDELQQCSHADVVWIDIADSGETDADALRTAISPVCGVGLTSEMLGDVLRPDPRPGVKRPDEGETALCVSAFRATAKESDKGAAPDSTSKVGVLVFEPIEFVVNGNWLITCWHDIEIYRGVDRVDERDPRSDNATTEAVVAAWASEHLQTSDDLAAALLREMTRTYMPTYQQFFDWQDEWELDFFRRADRVDRETLREVRASAAILREWLNPLQSTTCSGGEPEAWFTKLSPGGRKLATEAHRAIDDCMNALVEFSKTLRSAYDLFQLRTADRERERDDRFQRNIAVGGSVILIPTLVAGIMGANTWVPGQWREGHPPTHWDFVLLLAVVALSGIAAWVGIQWVQRRDDRA